VPQFPICGAESRIPSSCACAFATWAWRVFSLSALVFDGPVHVRSSLRGESRRMWSRSAGAVRSCACPCSEWSGEAWFCHRVCVPIRLLRAALLFVRLLGQPLPLVQCSGRVLLLATPLPVAGGSQASWCSASHFWAWCPRSGRFSSGVPNWFAQSPRELHIRSGILRTCALVVACADSNSVQLWSPDPRFRSGWIVVSPGCWGPGWCAARPFGDFIVWGRQEEGCLLGVAAERFRRWPIVGGACRLGWLVLLEWFRLHVLSPFGGCGCHLVTARRRHVPAARPAQTWDGARHTSGRFLNGPDSPRGQRRPEPCPQCHSEPCARHPRRCAYPPVVSGWVARSRGA